ncbi:hypothetical protein ACP70R_045227 [Stipagrostis hirtigluma subsp. patula]
MPPSSALLAAAEAAPPRRRQRRRGRPSESVTLHLSVFLAVPLPSRDWAELPPELISSVFHRLDPVHIMLAADKVCRSWRRAARDEPELWRRVDMRGHRALSFRGLVDLNKVAVDAVMRSRGECEAFLAGGTAVRPKFLSFLANQAPLLKSLRFPRLEELKISGCWRVNDKGTVLEAVAKACPRLKHLTYDNDNYIKDRDAMAIATMHELRSLRLIHNDLSNHGLAAILDNCLHLESLRIRNCGNVRMDCTLRAKCARIRTVKIHTDSDKVDDGEDSDPDTCDEREEFNPAAAFPISECDTCYNHFGPANEVSMKAHISDPRPICMVITTVGEVRSLLLDRNDLTSSALSIILDKCPHLDWLDIRRCRDIIMNNTSRDKHASIKPKLLTAKILSRNPYDLETFNPDGLDIRNCRDIIMNSYFYNHIMGRRWGPKHDRKMLRKRIKEYHLKMKKLLVDLIENKHYLAQTGWRDLYINMEIPDYYMIWKEKRFMDYLKYKEFDCAELELGCPISECSTCLLFEYFAKHWDDLDDDNDYADYYDISYGQDDPDETDFQVHDKMLGKRLRRYLKMG